MVDEPNTPLSVNLTLFSKPETISADYHTERKYRAIGRRVADAVVGIVDNAVVTKQPCYEFIGREVNETTTTERIALHIEPGKHYATIHLEFFFFPFNDVKLLEYIHVGLRDRLLENEYDNMYFIGEVPSMHDTGAWEWDIKSKGNDLIYLKLFKS